MQIKMIYNITHIHYLECIPISNSKNHNFAATQEYINNRDVMYTETNVIL